MIKFIIKLGNSAAHTSVKITRDEAILSLNNLFQFISWIDYCYSEKYTAGEFRENILPKDGLKTSVGPETTINFEEVMGKKDKPLIEQREKAHQIRIDTSNQRREHSETYDFETTTPNEMNTRKMYIDLDLKLAGWVLIIICKQNIQLMVCQINLVKDLLIIFYEEIMVKLLDW